GLVSESTRVQRIKSRGKCKQWKKYSRIAAIESIADMGKLMRRKRMKSNFVSSGTIRRRRTVRLSASNSRVRHELLRSTLRTAQPCSYRHNAWTPQANPIGHDQPGQGEGGEQSGDDADAKRHRESPHRPGADI